MAVNPSITQAGLDENFNLQLARNQIYNHAHVYKYGYNSAASTANDTVWAQGGSYTWPAAAAKLEVTSSSADDKGTPTAGTGARTVTLEGLDASLLEISETVTLNGQTAVETDAAFLRLHRMFVVTSGSGDTNAGVIYAANVSGTHSSGVPTNLALVYSTIAATEGQTLQSFYTVPANKTAYITDLYVSSFGSSTLSATITFRMRKTGESWRTIDKFIVFRSMIRINHEIPHEIPAGTDLEVKADSSASTVDVTASFDMILVKN